MPQLKFSLLICDSFSELPAEAGKYSDLFKNLFSSINPDIVYEEYLAYEDKLPVPEKDTIYFISGSNSSSYEEKPWILHLRTFIMKAVAMGCRFIGFCFGHQILNLTLGGAVRRSEKGWGIGLRKAQLLDPMLLERYDSEYYVLCNHHDQVVAIPPEAVLFSTSDFNRVEGMRLGHQVITMQSHPEYTVDYVKYIIDYDFPNESAEVKRKARESLAQHPPDSKLIAKMILDILTTTEEDGVTGNPPVVA